MWTILCVTLCQLGFVMDKHGWRSELLDTLQQQYELHFNKIYENIIDMHDKVYEQLYVN